MKQLWPIMLIAAGCAGQDVAETSDPLAAYEAAVAAENAVIERPTDGTIEEQMRVGVKLDALSTLTKRSMAAAVSDSITEEGTVRVLGKDVPLSWSSSLVGVELVPDDACISCLRVNLQLAGKWDLSLPITKATDEEARGEFSMIAPLAFEPVEGGEVAVFLDTASVLDVGGFAVETKLDKLPDKVVKPVTSKLDDLLSKAATRWVKAMPPIRLFTIKPFELADGGVELAPAGLTIDIPSKSVFIGLTTNVGPDPALPNPLRLGPEDGASLTYDVTMLRVLLVSQMTNGGLARRYDAAGEPTADGRYAITIDDVIASDDAVQIASRIWTLEGSNAGQAKEHLIEMPLGGDAGDLTDLPPPAQAVGAAAANVWKRLHHAPIQAPGMNFGLGSESTRVAQRVVHTRWGLRSVD